MDAGNEPTQPLPPTGANPTSFGAPTQQLPVPPPLPPTTPIPRIVPAFPSQSPPPAFPTQPVPTQSFASTPHPGLEDPLDWPPEEQPHDLRGRRWSGAAKATAGVLALTTIGGVGFGIAEFTRANDRADRITVLESDLSTANNDLDATRQQADAASGKGADLQTQLDAANGALAAATGQVDRLNALFPLTLDAVAHSSMAGTFALQNTAMTDDVNCSGFSNKDASCVKENFPPDLTIAATPDGGVTVASSWFTTPIPLAFADGQWTASGPVIDSVKNTCNDTANDTTVSVTLAPVAVVVDSASGALVASQLQGSLTLDSAASDQCVEAHRRANFVTATG